MYQTPIMGQPNVHDRFYYIERRYFDRSGWNELYDTSLGEVNVPNVTYLTPNSRITNNNSVGDSNKDKQDENEEKQDEKDEEDL